MDNRPILSPGLLGRCQWFAVAVAVFFLALSVQYAIKLVGNPEKASRSAILRWRGQLHDLFEQDIYAAYNYPNPPIMALILQPIAQLPPVLGSLTWFYLKLGLTFLIFHWAFRLIETPEQRIPGWSKALAFFLCLRPVMGDLSHGNVNLFIFFLIVMALREFQSGRDWMAGMWMGLAVACKVTPALFLPYFFWKRAWRTALGMLVSVAMFLLLVPGLCLGPARNLELLASWTRQMISPYVMQGAVTSDHLNQSLPGLVTRMLTVSPSIAEGDGTPLQFNNLAALDVSTTGWIIKGLMALFAAMIVWSCRASIRQRQGWRLAAEYSLVLVGMLLFSERTWKHHCVTLILPVAVISYCLTRGVLGRGRRLVVGACLAASIIAIATTTTTGIRALQSFDDFAESAHIFGAYVWANLLLVAALITALKQASPIRTWDDPGLSDSAEHGSATAGIR